MFSSEEFDVSTDKKQYFEGDTVNVRGRVPIKNPQPNVTLQVWHETHGQYRLDTAVPMPFSGMFSFYFAVGGPLSRPGKYEVRATCETHQKSAVFEVITGTSGASLHAYFLMVDIVGLTKTGSTNDQIRKIDALNWAIQNSFFFKEVLSSTNIEKFITFTGDGAIIGFTSYSEYGLALAVDICRGLTDFNQGRTPNEQLHVRIGLASGPVTKISDILGEENIYGPAIVEARRIGDLGEEGHILVSQSMRDELLWISREYATFIDIPTTLPTKHAGTVDCCNVHGPDFGREDPPKP